MPSDSVVNGISVLATGLFAGAALIVSVAEDAGRKKLPPQDGQKLFKAAFPREAGLQVILGASAAIACGTAAYHSPPGSQDRLVYGIAGGAMFSLFPYTQLCLMPTNWKLLSDEKRTDKEITTMFNSWSYLHGVRTVVGLGTLGLLLFGR